MTTLQLRIRTPWADIQPDPEDPNQDPAPAEAVYLAELLAGDVQTDTAAQDTVVETGDVSVTLASVQLAGATSTLDVRDERLRAVVFDLGPDGDDEPVEVLSGTVEDVGIGCDDAAEDGMRVWTVRVRETAREDIEAGLETVSARALEAALTAAGDVVQIPVRTHDGDGNLTSATWGWTDLRALVEASLRAAGATAATVPVPELGIYYGGDGSGAELARVPVRLGVATARGRVPNWTGTEAWERWAALMGARLYASYRPYPSPAIDAVARDGRWTEPDGQDGRPPAPPVYPALFGHDLTTEPAEAPGFRLVLGRAAYNVSDGYAPPPIAYEAGGSGERVEVDLLVPRVLSSGAVAATHGVYTETQTVGYPVIDRVADDVGEPEPGSDDPADGKVYLVAIVQTPGGPRALAYRTPDNPPNPAYGPARVCEAWAASLYGNHTMRSWTTASLQMEIDLDAAIEAGMDLPQVGTAAVGVSAEGVAWAVTSLQHNPDTGAAEITAVRPKRRLVDPYATSGGLSPGVYPEPTVFAEIRSEQAEGQAGPEGPIMFYAAGYAGATGADSVEMQMLAGSAWTAYTEGTRINVIDAADHRFFRARAIYAVYGVTSAWAYRGTDGTTEPPAGAPA